MATKPNAGVCYERRTAHQGRFENKNRPTSYILGKNFGKQIPKECYVTAYSDKTKIKNIKDGKPKEIIHYRQTIFNIFAAKKPPLKDYLSSSMFHDFPWLCFSTFTDSREEYYSIFPPYDRRITKDDLVIDVSSLGAGFMNVFAYIASPEIDRLSMMSDCGEKHKWSKERQDDFLKIGIIAKFYKNN